MMTLLISLTALLVTVLLAATTVISVLIFSQNKYGTTNQVAQLQAELDELKSRKSLDPKDINDRLIACENRLNISIGRR